MSFLSKNGFAMLQGYGGLFSKTRKPVPGTQRKAIGEAGGWSPGNRHGSPSTEWMDEGLRPPSLPLSVQPFPGPSRFEKRPPYPCKGDAKQRKPGLPTHSRLVQKQVIM
jgi:hypothetical protein